MQEQKIIENLLRERNAEIISFPTRETLQEHKEQCDYLIALLKKNDGWIPCSERLPNKEEYLRDDGRFIVTDGNRRYESCYSIYEHCFKTLKLFEFASEGRRCNFETDNCVIAWQPLPTHYKPKGE